MAHILKFIGPENAFDPETVALLSEAYDKAIGGMDDQGLPAIVCEMIAKRIIALATTGVRDPERLYAAGLAGLGVQR